ncbi:histidine kinase [Streptomyces sp. ET3-23]|uniref:sensor histidine kinase n=1 Tax=Streptomyces sp. ET3-23 TaxID=2885643 RepID=UPI001D102348|nr:ATP-binding protein [Streptomyces sp. ET3-23]MCC2277838.1 histidine kinase [Streptomyces sp. ET3-23]
MDGVVAEEVPGGPALARLLAVQSDSIVAGYEQRLGAIGVGADDPGVRRFCVGQARAVLEDVLLALLSEGSFLGMRSVGPAHGAIPDYPPAWNPDDAHRAIITLFDVVIEAVTHAVDGSCPGGSRMIAEGAVSLHHSIMARFKAALEAKARALLQETAQACMDDRRSVSRDLHDRVGYSVSVAKQNLELCELYQYQGNAAAGHKMRVAHQALHEALDQVRELASELRAYGGTDSLARALQACTEGIRTPGTAIEISVSGHESWMPADALDELYLALREALRNAFAHSRARTVTVHVDIAPHQTRAVVKDDGVGFDPAAAPEGVGLVCMRERIERLGGAVCVTGFPGRGASVEFLLPARRKGLVA